MSSIETRIAKLEANQKQIIVRINKQTAAINSLQKQLDSLEKRVADGEKLDQKQEAALNALKNVGKSIEATEQAVEVTPTNEIV